MILQKTTLYMRNCSKEMLMIKLPKLTCSGRFPGFNMSTRTSIQNHYLSSFYPWLTWAQMTCHASTQQWNLYVFKLIEWVLCQAWHLIKLSGEKSPCYINGAWDEWAVFACVTTWWHAHEISFLGCIGHLMVGSELKELPEIIYASSAVDHILTGKDISPAVSAHLLVDAALNAMLV